MNHIKVGPDVRRKMHQIEIYTRRLLGGMLVGDSRSAQRGTGLDFDQVREYRIGDDIRFIDWSATARMNDLLVKEYIEERSREIMFCLDLSGSTGFSSGKGSKREVMAEVASVLALVADYGKDRAGLLLFSDHVEKYIPPGKGLQHIHVLMELLFSYQPVGKKTSFSSALTRLAQVCRPNSVIFLMSDFIGIDKLDERLFAALGRRNDVIAVRCLDVREQSLPSVGFLEVEDVENGGTVLLDLRSSGLKQVNDFLAKRVSEQDALFKRCGIDTVDVRVKSAYIPDFVRFFRRRMQY